VREIQRLVKGENFMPFYSLYGNKQAANVNAGATAGKGIDVVHSEQYGHQWFLCSGVSPYWMLNNRKEASCRSPGETEPLHWLWMKPCLL